MLSLLRPRTVALAGLAAGALSFGFAYRFALRYRARAGLPVRSPVEAAPADFGLAFETVSVPAGTVSLAGWWIPAEGSGKGSGKGGKGAGEPRPAVVILHGWESNRGRSLAHVRYLHAAGFHCLAIDARGHGDNPPGGAADQRARIRRGRRRGRSLAGGPAGRLGRGPASATRWAAPG